jgi:hypothetical protein
MPCDYYTYYYSSCENRLGIPRLETLQRAYLLDVKNGKSPSFHTILENKFVRKESVDVRSTKILDYPRLSRVLDER